MRAKKLLTSILGFTFASSLTVLASSCSWWKVSIRVDLDEEVFVEYGQSIKLEEGELFRGNSPYQSDETVSMTLFDSENNEVIFSGNLFTPNVGDYKLVYSVAIDNVEPVEIKISCKDTLPPEIKFNDFIIDANRGDIVELPKYTFSDMSGVDVTTIGWSLTFNGEEVETNNNAFEAENVGDYALNIQCKDNAGNLFDKTYTIKVTEPFTDADLADVALFEFDQAGYINLVKRQLTKDSVSTYEVVTDSNQLPKPADSSVVDGALKITLADGADLKVKLIHQKQINPTSYGDGINNVYASLYAESFVDKVLWLNADGTELAKAVNVRKGWFTMSFSLTALEGDFGDSYLQFVCDEGTTLYIDDIYFGVKKNDIHAGDTDADGNIVIADMCSEEYVMDDIVVANDENLGTTTAYLTDDPNELKFVDGEHKGISFTRNNTIGVRSGFMYMFDAPLKLSDFAKIMVEAYTETASPDMWWGIVVGTRCYNVGDINKAGKHVYTIYKESINSRPFVQRDFPNGVEQITGVYFYSYKDKDENFSEDYSVIISKISYSDTIWSDAELAENYIADFDEKGYLDSLATSTGYSAEIVSPTAENIADSSHTTNVLKITGGTAWQYGLSYTFPEPVALVDFNTLNFELYVSSSVAGGNLVMQIYSSSGGVKYFNLSLLAGATDEWQTVSISTVVIDATGLKAGDSFEDISKITFSTSKVGLVAYIDSIYVTTGETISVPNVADFSVYTYSAETRNIMYGAIPADIQDETHKGDALKAEFIAQWGKITIKLSETALLTDGKVVYVNIYTANAIAVGVKFAQDNAEDFICASSYTVDLEAGWNLIAINTTELPSIVSGKTTLGYIFLQDRTGATTIYIQNIYYGDVETEEDEENTDDSATNSIVNVADFSNYTYSVGTQAIVYGTIPADIQDETHKGDALKADFTAQWTSITIKLSETASMSDGKVVYVNIYTEKAIAIGVKFAQDSATDFVCDGTNIDLQAGWNLIAIDTTALPNVVSGKTTLAYIFLQDRTGATTVYIQNVYYGETESGEDGGNTDDDDTNTIVNVADFSKYTYSAGTQAIVYGGIPESIQDETHKGEALKAEFTAKWTSITIELSETSLLTDGKVVYLSIYTENAIQIGVKFAQDNATDFVCDGTNIDLQAGWNLIAIDTTALPNVVSGKTTLAYIFLQDRTGATTVYIQNVYYGEAE